MSINLTKARLQAIRNALSYRLASRCSGDITPVEHYRQALAWATEEAGRRGHIDLRPRLLGTVITPSPQYPGASGMEARRAETAQTGSVHDSPTAEGGDAPNGSRSEHKGSIR